MRFPAPLRAPEGASQGLSSYIKRPRIRPVHVLINIAEGLLGLLGVVLIILVLHYGSFARAGGALDASVAWICKAAAGLIARIHA